MVEVGRLAPGYFCLFLCACASVEGVVSEWKKD